MSDDITDQTVVLYSNGCASEYPTNQRDEFKNNLPSYFSIPKNRWEIGVQSFIADNKFSIVPPNVSKQLEQICLASTTSRVIYPITIYNTDDLVDVVKRLETLKDAIALDQLNLLGNSSTLISSWSEPKGVYNFKTAEFLYLWVHDKTLDWFGHPITPWMVEHKEYWRNREYFPVTTHVTPLTIDLNTLNKPYYPREVNVVLEEVQPHISGSEFSKTIASIPYQTKYQNDLCMEHSFSENEFFELDNQSTSVFKVSLLNEDSDFLYLPRGQPTIVNLRLRPKMGEHFILSLASNYGKKEFPKNRNSNFQVTLAKQLLLPGRWEVALTSCIMSADISLSSYMNETHFWIVSFAGVAMKVYFEHLANKPVFTAVHLAESMNILTRKAIGALDPNSAAKVNLTKFAFYASEDGEISVGGYLGTGGIVFSASMASALGYNDGYSGVPKMHFVKLDELPTIITDVHQSAHTPDYNIVIGKPNLSILIPQAIMIYSDFTSPIIAGNIYSPILKVIAHKVRSELKFGEAYLYEPRQLSFVKVGEQRIARMAIELRDAAGLEINLLRSVETRMNLLFRKIRD